MSGSDNRRKPFVLQEGRDPKFEISIEEIDADHFVITLAGLKPDGSKDATMTTTYSRKK